MNGQQRTARERIVVQAVCLGAVLVVVTAAVALSAELNEAEIEGTANQVTIEQGGAAGFTVRLTATGAIRCTATPSNPAKAILPTEYSIDGAGTIASSTPSAPASFYADASCNVTWAGDPTAQQVHAIVRAALDTPPGTYTLRLKPTLSTPGGTGATLRDDTATMLSFVVNEARDRVPPVVACDAPRGTAGAHGWYTSAVTVGCTATDAGSGLMHGEDAAFTLSTSGEGGVSTNAHTVADRAGNESAAGPFGSFDVDLHAPSVAIASPAEGAIYLLNQKVDAAFGCSDSASGIDECDGSVGDGAPLPTGTVGTRTLTVHALDRAGRDTTAAMTYRVVYDFGALSTPGTESGQALTRKAGSALPIRWSLDGVDDLSSFVSARSGACGSDELSAGPGAASLNYDAAMDRFQLVWKTDKSWAGSCRSLQITLADGTTHALAVTFT